VPFVFSNQQEIADMQSQTEHRPQTKKPDSRPDERVLLLEEINFKWLLAGMGLWIDMSRFHNDPSYAAHFLALAEASSSLALRNCAALLQGKNDNVGSRQADH
jgi:hypothetical protein